MNAGSYLACALNAISLYKERIMSQYKSVPHLSDEGVAFTVTVDSIDRECLIEDEALQQLSQLRSRDAAASDTLEVFHAFESKINGVARRLVAAGVQGTPLVLTRNTFFSPPHRT